MRKLLTIVSLFMSLATSASHAGDLGINVILSGEIKPGVYGQVEIGNTPKPRLVYDEPRVIVVDKRYVQAEPIYLHVPPGHAKHWDKHCREYNACGRRVYFVRTEEYDDNDHREHEEHRGKNKHH